MRYKVKTESDRDFEKVMALAAANTHIFVASARRRTISTGDLSEAVKSELSRLGAKILPDFQYHADAA